MKTLFTGDSFVNGLVLGLVFIALTSGILLALRSLMEHIPYWLNSDRSILLLSLVPGVIAMRIFFLNRKADRTGRGILLVTFLTMLAAFLLLK
ncbi:MAG: hypothetical protein IPM52_12585 [Bacteroidetes bacterium]|nr:hypothetical protein [Bacteroidota bacterium]